MSPPAHRLSVPLAGYSLVEVLSVVGIMILLAGLCVNTIIGAGQKSMAERTRSQLVLIGTALAQYKQQYGDYPQTDRSEDLFDALTGKLGPKGAHLNPAGKAFLPNLGLFTLSAPDKINDTGFGANTFLDSWGKPLNYVYKDSGGANWKNPSYVLFSDGPDGKHVTPVKDSLGFPNNPNGEDADNIYEPSH